MGNNLQKVIGSIASLSPDEFQQLQSIFAKAELVEQNARSHKMEQNEVNFNAEQWLSSQKEKSNESIFLNGIKNYHHSRVEKQQEKVEYFSKKISRKTNKISRLLQSQVKANQRINKLSAELPRLEASKAFLKSVDNSHSMVDLMISIAKKNYNRCVSQIEFKKAQISIANSKITACRSDISKYQSKISKAEKKISEHAYRMDHIKEFQQLNLPYEALSYYIAEKTKTDIATINEALNNPSKLYTETEINNGKPITIEDTKPDDVISKEDIKEVSSEQIQLYSEFNDIEPVKEENAAKEALPMEPELKPTEIEKFIFMEVTGEQLDKIRESNPSVKAQPNPAKQNIFIIKGKSEEITQANNIIKNMSSKENAITR